MPYFLFSPLTWGLVLSLAMILGWRRLGCGARIAGLVAGALLWLLAAPLGANLLQRAMEAMVPAQARCAAGDTAPIVLLSGGYEREPVGLDDYVAFRFETWRRTREATDLWHAGGDSELWIAGGGPYAAKESAMLERLARDWRVPAAALHIETRSQTTWESAVELRGLLPDRVRLVTSPVHQPRSLLAFRAAGFEPCAQDVGSDVSGLHGPGALLPQVSSLEKAEIALYELVGIVWYRLRELRGG